MQNSPEKLVHLKSSYISAIKKEIIWTVENLTWVLSQLSVCHFLHSYF